MDFFLTSSRLLFRHWTQADLSLAIALWGNPQVARYLGGPFFNEACLARLQHEMERQRTVGLQYWPVFYRKTEVFAGCAGLRPYRDDPRVLELGVHIARPFWSERLGEEAARTVIRYAFEELGVHTLVAGHYPEHLDSQSLIERLGFVFMHKEPWGPMQNMHPFYRLDASGGCASKQ